jgi:hypothetical protein
MYIYIYIYIYRPSRSTKPERRTWESQIGWDDLRVPGEGRGEAVEGGVEAGEGEAGVKAGGGEGGKYLMTRCELRLRRARTSMQTGDTF